MKQDQLKAWQPDQFDRFVRILEQDQLNHAYLLSTIKKYGQDTISDRFLLQNDKNLKLFDKYACQK